MAITQIGVATFSDELLAYIKTQIKNGTIEWSDLIDSPDYVGQDGKFLRANSGGGSASMSWQSLPAAGLNWQAESTNFTATDKVGILASNGIVITLPGSPSIGTLVAVADHNGEFDTNPITIRASNGLLIEGDTDLIVDLRNAYVQVIFDGSRWELAQVNHPFNVQEITEESFPGGQISYTLSRTPANRSSLLISNAGYIIPTTGYSVAGNVLSFGTAPVGNVFVRHIGIPSAVKVSDTPIGAMLYFPNGEAVDGWLDCTGGSIGRSVYPDLVKYLSKSADAETAFLPDARGNFIRTWDHGAGLDTIGATTIPNVLRTNEWGKWLDTTESSTASNLWDGSTITRTTVRYDKGYIGYRFDAPVSASALHITTSDAISGVHVPTSMQVKASNDGITWTVVSAADTGPFQNRTVTLLTNTSDAYRFWAVFGTGGTPYTGNSDYYWGVTSLVFTATTQNRAIGGFQGQASGSMNMTLNGSTAGVGQVQSGTGAVVPLAGATGTIEGGVETRPDNQSYVLRIKAFHYQSGALSDSSVTQLRSEVSRLSTQVNDGTSYVQDTAPENPSENARWYDTTSGRTYLWFNDGDSYQWVDDSPQATSSARESINAADVLATGTTTKRPLNNRFADYANILDFGALKNSTGDSKAAFDLAWPNTVFVPSGSYQVSAGDFTGGRYFSFGPVSITGGSTGIDVVDLGNIFTDDIKIKNFSVERVLQDKLKGELLSILDFGGKDDDDGSFTTTNNKDAFAAYFSYLNSMGGGKLYLPKTDTGGYFINGDDTTPVTSPIEIVADEGVYLRIIYSGGINNSPFANNNLKYNRELLKIQQNFGFNNYGATKTGLLPSGTLPSIQSGYGVYTKPTTLSGFNFLAVDLADPDNTVTPSGQSADAIVFDGTSKTVCAMKYADIGDETVALCRNSSGGLHFAGVKTLNGYSYYAQDTSTQGVVIRESTTGLSPVLNGVPYTLLNQQRDLFNNSLLSVRIITNRMYSVMCNGLVVGTYETRSDITGVIFGTEDSPSGSTSVSQFSKVVGSKGGGSKPLRIISCGDSISDNDVQYSPYRYMSSIMQTSGQQIAELNNIAKSGETSSQQLARLLTVGAGYDYCLIQIGVNDVQGGVAFPTFSQNIIDMCNYAISIGAKPIVGVPTQWYSLAEANAHGQTGGQNTTNNEQAFTYKALLIRAVAETGALINMQTIKNMGAITASWLDSDIDGVQEDPLLVDNIHPTPYGAMMIGLSWAESLWGSINGNGAKNSETLESVPVSWLRNGFGTVSRPSFSNGKLNGQIDFGGGANSEGNPFMQLPAHLRPIETLLVPVVSLTSGGLPSGLASLYIGTDGNCYGFNIPASSQSLAFKDIDVLSKSLK